MNSYLYRVLLLSIFVVISFYSKAQVNYSIDSLTYIYCTGTSPYAAVSGTGGTAPYTYVWSTGETGPIATQLASGVNFVTITDFNNDSVVAPITVFQTPPLTFQFAQITPISCTNMNDGAIDLNMSGGNFHFTYAWSHTSADTGILQNLVPGNYSVTVTDQSGCIDSSTFTFTNPTPVAIQISYQNNTNCFGSSNGLAMASTTGGTSPYTYNWPNGSTQSFASGFSAGTYTVQVTDSFGCADSTQFTITEPTPITSSITYFGAPSCYNGTNGIASATASGSNGGFSYSWGNGELNDTAYALSPGAQYVTITDALGCLDTLMVQIPNAPQIITTATVTQPIACNGDSTGIATVSSVNTNGAEVYAWSNGATGSTAIGFWADTFMVTVTDGLGCTDSASIVFTQPAPLAVANPLIIDPNCPEDTNGVISVTPTGGVAPYQITWSNGADSTVINNLSIGDYYYTITDASNCTYTNMISIVNNFNAPNLSLGADTAICMGDTLVISAPAAATSYVWSTNSTQASINALPNNTYVLTITNTNGCEAIDSIVIGELPAPIVTGQTTANLCVNDSVFIAVNSGYDFYQWSNGVADTGTFVTTAGLYQVTVSAANGCTKTHNITVANFPTPMPNLGADFELCINDTATISADPGFASYAWNTGANTASIQADAMGTYMVTVTDQNGCLGMDTVSITGINLPTPISLGFDTIICIGDSIEITPGAGFNTYTWSTGQTTPSIFVSAAGDYYVTVTNTYTCESYADKNIGEKDCGNGGTGINEEWEQQIVVYPNPILNNRFTIKGVSGGPKISVYSLHGQLMFETKAESPEIEILVNNWAKGMYVVRIQQNNTTINRLIQY